MQIIPTRRPKQHFQRCFSGIFLLVLWEREQSPGSSLISCTLILCQGRPPIAATVICRSPSDWSFCQPRIKKALNDSANVSTRQQKRPEISFTSPAADDQCFPQDRTDRRASASPLWSTSDFSTPLPAVLTHATLLLTFAGPTSLLYATTQMSALFPMMNESPFSAHLSCLPVVCPCWRNNLPFPVLRRAKGTPEVTGKEMAAVGKFRYLIKRTDKGAARWTEDISAKAQDGIWKSGSVVGLLKYCYCTAMQWSSEDNECTRVHAHTRTHINPTGFTQKPRGC